MRGAPLKTAAAAETVGDGAQNQADGSPEGGLPAADALPSDALSAFARYDANVKDLSVAEVERRRLRNPRDRTIYREVARQFGVGEQSLRLWVKKRDAERLKGDIPPEEQGEAPSPEQMRSELQSLRRQIQKLRTENDVLKRAFVVFSTEWGSEK